MAACRNGEQRDPEDQDRDGEYQDDDTLPAVRMQRTSPTAVIIGASKPMRKHIDRNVWICVTSVVFRVISEDDPNLSIYAAEKLSTL